MSPGSLWIDEKGSILLYKESFVEDYHKRTKSFLFKVISSKSIKDDTITISGNFLCYLRILPTNHPAWILYGVK